MIQKTSKTVVELNVFLVVDGARVFIEKNTTRNINILNGHNGNKVDDEIGIEYSRLIFANFVRHIICTLYMRSRTQTQLVCNKSFFVFSKLSYTKTTRIFFFKNMFHENCLFSCCFSQTDSSVCSFFLLSYVFMARRYVFSDGTGYFSREFLETLVKLIGNGFR